MSETIDCLFIGHNEMDFPQYEGTIRKMGENSGAYRDLNLNFIRYNNRPYTISEIFNIFYYQNRDKGGGNRPNFFMWVNPSARPLLTWEHTCTAGVIPLIM